MEFELGVADRITLLGSLPPEEVHSNFLTLKTLRVFREELSLSPEEANEIEYCQVDGKAHWKVAKEKPKHFDIDDNILKVIQGRLRELDRAGRLLDQHMPVYEKFVLPEEESEQDRKALRAVR